MGKGILLEMAGRQAVVLTPQGEFKKVPMPGGNWEIGDEINFAETRQQPAWLRWSTAAAAAAVFLVGSFTGIRQYQLAQPVVVVTVDINPSLELTLNMKDQVLKATALNADGELVLEGVDYKRKPLDTVLAALTDRAVEEQKLNPADETSAVLVGVAPAKAQELPPAQAERVVEKAKSAVRDEVAKVASAKGQEPKTNVAVLVATREEKQKAEQEGLSVGKSLLLPSIQAVAPEVTQEELQRSGPGKVIREHGVSPSEVFSNAEKKNEESHEKKNRSDENKTQPAGARSGDNRGTGKQDDRQPSSKQDEPTKVEPKQDASKQGDPRQDEPKKADPRQDEPKRAEPRQDEPNKVEPKQIEPKKDEPKQSEPKKGEPKQEEPKKGEPKQDEPKKDEPKKDQPRKDEPRNDDGKKDSWTIPWLGITIEKPAFLRTKSEEKPTEAAAAPAQSTPRAEEPGVGAPQSDEPKREEPKREEPKREEPKGEEPKGEEPKREEPKREETKGQDQKQGESKRDDVKSSDSKQDDQKKPEKENSKGRSGDSGRRGGPDK